MSGGFTSFPVSFGASVNTIHETMLDALLQAQGSAIATDIDSAAYVECYAKARLLADMWSTVIRLGNQFDPNKMTDFLPRWEAIYGIVPSPTATLAQRRALIASKIANYGNSPTIQVVTDLLALVLGDVFVTILYGSDTIQDGYYAGSPGIEGFVPGGANLSVVGGFDFPDESVNNPNIPFGFTEGQGFNQQGWSSTMAYLAILVQQPSWMSDQVFLSLAGQIDPLLEDLLPAWVLFAWVENNSNGTLGFILDEQNLDKEAFLP